MTTSSPSQTSRRKNPRGQGHVLRQQFIEAATDLLADLSSADLLTIRAVARVVGVTPASIYSHFSGLDALVGQVLEERYSDLANAIESGAAHARTPMQDLVARSWAYCRWGLDHPGHYRVVFGGRTASKDETLLDSHRIGDALLEDLSVSLAAASGSDTNRERRGLHLWTGMHGIVSLRIDKPTLDWPPFDDLLVEVIVLHSGASRSQVLGACRSLGFLPGFIDSNRNVLM